MSSLDNLIDIVEIVTGPSKNGYSDSKGWSEYNCPNCREENDGIDDNKYNLAINFEKRQWAHCWKCGWAGKLSKLVKIYGSSELYLRYIKEIKYLKESKLYTLDSDDIVIDDDFDDTLLLTLPNGFTKINMNEKSLPSVKYLKNRGITQYIVDKFNIGYIGDGYNSEYKLKNRIIIPSYNIFGELNYWVGRDYIGNNKLKYCNPNVSKNEIIFNEALVNWYEPITLVEGPFDHISVPNSIPLLGKTINNTMVYESLINKSKSYINIWLDDDAYESTALPMYKELNSNKLRERVRLIKSPPGYDPSELLKKYGKTIILKYINSAFIPNEYSLNRMIKK